MSVTIQVRRAAGAPSNGVLLEGEPGWDTTNDDLYIGAAGGTTVQLVGGTSSSAAVASNTTHRTSTGTDHGYIDQTVVIGSTPSFVATNITGLPAASVLAGTLGTGAYVFDNTVSGITILSTGLGAAATPSYTFGGDLNTGMWSSGADILNFSTAGTERLEIKADGDFNFQDNDITTTGTGTFSKALTPEVKTDTAAPTDLTVTTGAAKTIALATPVYKDINIAGYLLTKPTSSAPGVVSFVDEAGADTTIETYAFAVGELVHGGFELQHDYKEGTDLTFHVHWQGITAPSGTDNVQWRLTYILMRDGTTLNAAVTIDSPDSVFDTQYETIRTDFAAITGTNFKIGDQFMFTLTRVAATGDAYVGDALIATAGVHYQVDTIGSRVISTK